MKSPADLKRRFAPGSRLRLLTAPSSFAIDADSAQYLWTDNHQKDATPEKSDIEAAIIAAKGAAH